MKIRLGFVSNSSSSSFLIGAGKIRDFDAFKKWMTNKDIEKEVNSCCSTSFKIITTSQILELSKSYGEYYQNGNLNVEACINLTLTVWTPVDSSKEENYCIVSIGNDEGDQYFWNEELRELEYDKVDKDWFQGVQKDILEMLESDMLANCKYRFGAARNG